jgi:hypothetical protein
MHHPPKRSANDLILPFSFQKLRWQPQVSLSLLPRGRHKAELSVDVVAPRGAFGRAGYVNYGAERLAKTYIDGMQLYRCKIDAPKDLERFPAGLARRLRNGAQDPSSHRW